MHWSGAFSIDGAAYAAGLADEIERIGVRVFAHTPVVQIDPYQIIFSSGTTGDPKGIVGNHRRIGATAFVAQLFGYQPDERPYTGLSFSHNNAQTTALIPALKFGYRAVISRRFTKSKLWDVCRRYGCTSFSVLGGMATALFAEPPRANDADNPVRMVISGGMPAAIWVTTEADSLAAFIC